jgi:C-terminal processing protease CtpA/Prc
MNDRALASFVLALLLTGAAPAAAPHYDPALEARVFDRVWGLVRDKYWNRARVDAGWTEARAQFRPRAVAAPDRRAFYTILGEMLATLGDSHVYAIDPVQMDIGDARDAGEAAQGFGIDMLPDDQGDWRVARLRPASPAARAGVQIGWKVVRVNDREFDIDYQPRAGETARFLFEDDAGQPRTIPLAAELEEPAPLRRAEALPGNILLVALGGFDPGDDRWIRDEIDRARPAGLILDLRGNGGGEAGAIARVGGLFFADDRPLVRRIGRRTSIQDTHGAGDYAYRGPLAVLVDNDSASGAEAVAALIQENRRGPVVGTRTAGALTGAGYYRLPDGGQLAVAEFDITTAGGQRLEGVGLMPDVEIRPTLADRRSGRDTILQRALALVRSGASSRRSPGSG